MIQFPVQFSFLGTNFYLHNVLEFLAFFVGMRIYYYQKRKITDQISNQHRLWILIGAMIGALIGSRVVALLENPSTIGQQTWLTFYQNKTVAGGFLGGIFGVELVKKIINEKQNSGDLYVIPMIVALIIGRIGCFSMGVAEPTFGNKTTFFMGLNLGDGILRHPTSLYEIIYLLLLLLFFSTYRFNQWPHGNVFKLWMSLYFLYRFVIEYLKPHEVLGFGFSSIQWCSIIIFTHYTIYYLLYFYKNKKLSTK